MIILRLLHSQLARWFRVYEYAMQAVQKTIADCYKEFNMAVYVMKVIPGYQALK